MAGRSRRASPVLCDIACGSPPPGGPDLRPVAGAAADRELALLAKALGHPVRVHILRLLAQRGTCVCAEFVGEIGLAQSTVSQHLKILKQASLLYGQLSGPRTCYGIAPAALRRLKALVGGL